MPPPLVLQCALQDVEPLIPEPALCIRVTRQQSFAQTRVAEGLEVLFVGMANLVIVRDLPILQDDDAVRLLGDSVVVGDDDDGGAETPVEIAQQIDDISAAL